jgi:hypothetical protein
MRNIYDKKFSESRVPISVFLQHAGTYLARLHTHPGRYMIATSSQTRSDQLLGSRIFAVHGLAVVTRCPELVAGRFSACEA